MMPQGNTGNISWKWLIKRCKKLKALPTPLSKKQMRKNDRAKTLTGLSAKNGELLPDEQRLTKFGKVLRATSLDELPEAFNILKGDMSVIGPRPLLVKYLPRYSERQHRRHEVRPGLSGYAQVHGRNTVSWQDKFEMDVKYVDHITFLGDLKIIWGSVMAAFVRRGGISSETSVTMEEFMGNGMVAK